VRYLLTQDVDKVIILSRDELKQYNMRLALDDDRMRYFIGDVRDLGRLRLAFQDVDVVIHAAAMKQVPACEYNPWEAVQTNVVGAWNVVQAALECGVGKVIALSSDKAVNPVNLYGATKLVAEKLFVQANVYRGLRDYPLFSVVRYGNVVGSRGSVIPLFKEQAKTGVLTITDARMTRFWMTLDQAIRLVQFAWRDMTGAEIYVPAFLAAMPIVELAQLIAPKAEIKYVGIRPGEKLHEVLISTEEGRRTYLGNGVYIILPDGHPRCDPPNLVHPDFEYSSRYATRPSQAEVDEWLK